MARPFHLIWLLAFSALACSQSPTAAATGGSAALITFTLDFPESQPEHYSIRVPADGLAHYQSSGRLSADTDATDSFDFDFPLSAEMRHKIFALADKAGYFQKDLDSHHKNLAFTGKKTLTYKDASRTGEASYNFSSNPAAQDLTSLFQNLSATLEFGHRIDYDRRYQKLALDAELKRMQEMAQTHMLVEVSAIHPILEQFPARLPARRGARTQPRAQQVVTKLSRPSGTLVARGDSTSSLRIAFLRTRCSLQCSRDDNSRITNNRFAIAGNIARRCVADQGCGARSQNLLI